MLVLVFIIFYVSACEWGKYPDPSDSSGNTCLKCDVACGDCTSSGAHNCGQCSSSYAKIQGICMEECPLGYSKVNSICEDKTSDGISFNIDFSYIKNSIVETCKIEGNEIPLSAGSSTSFYPSYDSFDPYVVKERGFYFDGSAYFSGSNYLLTFGPVFTLALWIRPIDGTGYIFAKQNDTDYAIAVKLESSVPTLYFNLTTLKSFSATKSVTLDSWNFLMIKMNLDSYKAKVSISLNSNTDTSSVFSSYFIDLFKGFYTSFGAQYSSSSYSSFYKGFIFMFRLSNQDLSSSNFVQSSGCSGCTLCPAGNSDLCLSTCDLSQYISSSSCEDCSSECTTYGCVRSDIKCNLCQDQKCSKCETFSSGCTECISHAYINTTDGLCVCDYNYIWDDIIEECRPCGLNCQTCDGGGYLGCSQCKEGFFMHWGLCVSSCPTGYEKSGSECVLSGSKRIMDMKFNKVEGVVYDSKNNIPAVTGTSSTFYPDYEDDDPIAAYRRGYYFTGTAVMHFAPYLTYTSPYLMFSPVFYIGLWLNPAQGDGILFSSVNSTYSSIVVLVLSNSYPKITLSLADSSSNFGNSFSLQCSSALDLDTWSFLVVKVELDSHERSFVTCYVNTVAGTTGKIGQGHLADVSTGNKMNLATIQTGSSAYASGWFKGFIYQVILDVDIDYPNAGYSTSCETGCSACPVDKTCLSACKIDQYPSGSNLMSCTSCDQNCVSVGCVDSDDNCNICEDDSCKVCTTYEYDDCTSYFCNSNQYKKKGMTECKDCHSTCTTCDGDGPMNCTSCTNSYLLNGGCHSFCPTGYSSSNNKCTMTQDKIFDLNLLEIKGIVPEDINDFEVIAGSDLKFYPDFDSNDPWPVIYRGHYFNGGQYLDLPPNSENSTFPTLGNQFTFSFWIRSENDGVIFSKQSESYSNYIVLQILSKSIKVSLKLDSLDSFTSSSNVGTNWTYVVISFTYQSDSTTQATIILNQNQQQSSLGSGLYSDLQSNCYLTIGATRSSSSFSSFWTGFLYSFSIFSSNKDPKDYSALCDSKQFSCTLCPSSTSKCLDTCPHNTWFSQNKCQDCQTCSYESCRRNDKSCNLCQDAQCKVCDTFWSGSCSECKPNADLSDGECTCTDGYVWDNIEEKCVTCDQFIVQGACIENCPTGFTANGNNCEADQKQIFSIELDKKIRGRVVDSVSGTVEVVTGLTTEFYPYYDDNDPYAGKDRGYYFNGDTSYMAVLEQSDTAKVLTFSPTFAVAFWVLPVAPGVLIAKQVFGSVWLQVEIGQDFGLGVKVKIQQVSEVKEVTSLAVVSKNSWNLIGFFIRAEDDTSSVLRFFVNSVQEDEVGLGLTPFVDVFSSFTFTIGARYNSSNMLNDYFTGYIHSIKVWNFDYDVLKEGKTSCSGCSICPKNGVCLPTCSLNKYLSTTCKDCKSPCTKGCVRGEDCNLCNDRLCEFCDDYTSTGCTKCVDGADFDSGICKCINSTAKSRSNGNLYCVSECGDSCKQCYSSQNGDCSTCKESFYLDNGICVQNCPSGKTINSNECSGHSKSKILHYVFNKTLNNPPDLTQGLKAFMGSNEKYLHDYDENDPIPVYKRGVYFDGNNKYVQLPANPAETSQVIFGNIHSIKIWLRAKSQSSSACVASKESSTKYFSILLDSSLTPIANYQVRDIYDNSTFSTLKSSGKSLTSDKWHQLIIHFTRSGRSSTSTIFLDGTASVTSYILKSYFDEPSNLLFKLGYSALNGFSFKGFIYEFIIFNYLATPTDPSSNPCYCELCTESGDCLNSCEFDEYILNDTCDNCLSDCPNSCLDYEDCSLNPDPLCEDYSGFEAKDCIKCVELAEMTEAGCKCGENTISGKYSCECISDFEELENKCVPCFYHLQTSDIDAYFSEDFLSIEFEMKIAVQSKTSSKCSELFTDDSLASLGEGAVCSWSNSMKLLKVVLGEEASVVSGTIITFRINTLLSNIKQCGSNRGPISAQLYFKFDPPVIIPEAFIDAPYDYYIYCGNLSISGERSSGGYGRKLQFTWSFDSNPYLDILTNGTDLTSSSLLYINETLSPSTVQVYLTVTNWLGFNSTTDQTIEIFEGVGIQLALDTNIKWKLTSQYPKSIFVSPSSECKISNDLTYTWSLNSMTGNDSYINEELFWTSQKTPSKLYIPKGALGPGFYIFKLSVHDNVLNINGRTYLKFLIFYSDLQVNFNPSYTTFNKQSDLVLNGDAGFDPDNIQGSMTYFWTCFNGSDCSSILSEVNKKSPVIKKEDLEEGTEYQFGLNITKADRKASAVLTVLINSSSVLTAIFTKPPTYINNQENFILKPELDLECNCTFEWKIVQGSKYNLSTDVHSKDLGISPFSLNEGEIYSAQLHITHETGAISVFKENFQVDLLPVAGKLEVSVFAEVDGIMVYKITANGWNDPKDSNLPLTYQFGYYYEGKEMFLNVKNESAAYYTGLPEYEDLEIFVRVYDIFGCFSETKTSFNALHGSGDLEKVVDLLEFYVELDWADPDMLPSYLSLVSRSFTGSLVNETDVARLLNVSLRAVEKLMESMQDIDFTKLDVLLNLGYVLGSYPLGSENKTSIFSLLSAFNELVNDNDIILSEKRGNSYVEIIEVVSEINYYFVTEDINTLQQANEILKTLALSSLNSFGQSQSLSFGLASIQVCYSLLRGDHLLNSSSSSGASSISLPSSSLLSHNSSESILTILISYNSIPELYNTSEEFSSATEFSIFQITSGYAEYIELDLHPEVLILEIPVFNLDKTPKCVYWDIDSWSTQGCRLINLQPNLSYCACSHTSLYSSGSHFILTNTSDNKEPIVIYISCIVALIWIVLVAFLIVKDRKETESKIFVEKILAGLPLAGFKKSPRVLPNEIADQLGRVEKIDEKRDSNYIPAARIGIVGSYFDDRNKFAEKDSEILKNSEMYCQVKSGNYEKAEILPFEKKKNFEEMKEEVHEGEEVRMVEIEKNFGKPVVMSETVSILPSQNFEEMRKKSSKRITAIQMFEEHKKEESVGLKSSDNQEIPLSSPIEKFPVPEARYPTTKPSPHPSSKLSSKAFPKLPGLAPIEINPDEYSKPVPVPVPGPIPSIPSYPSNAGLPKAECKSSTSEIQGFERKNYNPDTIPTRTSSKNSSFKKPQLSPIEINPNEDEGIDLDFEKPQAPKPEVQYKSKKFDYIVAEDIENQKDSAEKAAGEPKLLTPPGEAKGPEEEKYENTELFTQPSSPRNQLQFRRKKHEDQEIPHLNEVQERVYMAWVADYFLSALIFYHEVFSRVSRCTQGVASFLLQVLTIGLILAGMGSKYAEDKGKRFDVKVKNVLFQDVAVAFSMAILCNLITSVLLVLLFRKRLISPYAFDSERGDLVSQNKKIEMTGLVVFSLIVLGSVVGTGLTEMNMNRDGSILWAIVLFIAFVFDFFLIQICKIGVYHYLMPGLILPSK